MTTISDLHMAHLRIMSATRKWGGYTFDQRPDEAGWSGDSTGSIVIINGEKKTTVHLGEVIMLARLALVPTHPATDTLRMSPERHITAADLEADRLYRVLDAGTATPRQCREAASWLRQMHGFPPLAIEDSDVALPEPSAHTRRSDPQTSHDAGRRLREGGTLSPMMKRVLQTVAHHRTGLTDVELEIALGVYTSGPRSRRADLTEAGIIVDSGETRVIDGHGENSRIVWKLADGVNVTKLLKD